MSNVEASDKKLHTVNLHEEGLVYKPSEPQAGTEDITADMARDALDSLFADPSSDAYEKVDSRAAELIGSRGRKPAAKATKLASFGELKKEGVKFNSNDAKVRTASYDVTRFLEAFDRSEEHEATAPKLTSAPDAKKRPDGPKVMDVLKPASFDMHDFDGPRPKMEDFPLGESLRFYTDVGAYDPDTVEARFDEAVENFLNNNE